MLGYSFKKHKRNCVSLCGCLFKQTSSKIDVNSPRPNIFVFIKTLLLTQINNKKKPWLIHADFKDSTFLIPQLFQEKV